MNTTRADCLSKRADQPPRSHRESFICLFDQLSFRGTHHLLRYRLSQRQYGAAKSEAFLIAKAAGAEPAKMPSFIEPLLASARDKPLGGELWVHEIKYDGYRVQLHKSDAATKVYTRRGFDWSLRFPTIVQGAWHLAANSAILDGEAVVLTVGGQTDFSALESYVSSKDPGRSKHNLVFIAFDLLHLDGMDLKDGPLIERKRSLKALLTESHSSTGSTWKRTGHPCSVTRASSNGRASYRSDAMPRIIRVEATTRRKLHAASAKRLLSPASLTKERSSMARI
jgi:hypothetical protein